MGSTTTNRVASNSIMTVSGKSEEIFSVIEAFQVFDKAGKGFISSSEFRHVITSMGDTKLNGEEVDEMIGEFAVDGLINYAEMIKMLMSF